MISQILSAASLAALVAAQSTEDNNTIVAWSGFDRWSFNSYSELGTKQSDYYPNFFKNNPLPAGKPWGQRDSDTNYYTDYPITGVTRTHNWTVSKQPCSPDGIETTCLLVNGQFPGPAIEANWGDNIEVHLTNNVSDEGTGIHWHGILQKDHQAMDGVPGVSICPIAPGETFTYNFPAELYGSSYWHSHYSSQFASGLTGPIIIYGPNASTYDIDLGPAQFSDWYHDYYETLLERLTVPLSESPEYPYSQNVLVNGKNPFNCDKAGGKPCEMAPLSRFNLTSGKTHRLRLINTSAESLLKISLDGHTFKVMANDYVEIEPYETNVVTLGVGQRSDVLIEGKASTHGAYWLRAVSPHGCSANSGQNVGKAAIYYEDADDSQLPFSEPWSGYDNSYCFNDPLEKTVPVMSLDPGEPDVTETIVMEGHSNGTHGKWWMNNITANVDYDDPVLLRAKMGYTTFPEQRNVYQYNSSVKSVRYILQNKNGNAHPMHLHGHNIFVMAEGEGEWDGKTYVNPSNPQRRDVQMVRANGYLVIQWFQDNPGAWPLHCHISWHLSLGMVVQVLESPELIHKNVAVPSTVSQTCRDWWAFQEHSPIEVLDSGL